MKQSEVGSVKSTLKQMMKRLYAGIYRRKLEHMRMQCRMQGYAQDSQPCGFFGAAFGIWAYTKKAASVRSFLRMQSRMLRSAR